MSRRLILMLVMLAVAFGCLAQTIEKRSAFTQQRSLQYYVDLPENYSPDRQWPLVVCLHGYGGSPQGFEDVASRIVPGGAIGLRPQGLIPMDDQENWRTGYAWYTLTVDEQQHHEMLEASTRWVLQALQEVKDAYPVAKDKVFLYGFSQGGILSYHLGLCFPELFLGVIPAGAMLDEAKLPLYPLDNRARRLPFMAMHGAFDQVISYEAGRSAVDTLNARGVPAAIRCYPARHAITPPMLDDARDFVYRITHQGETPLLDHILLTAMSPDELDQILLAPATPSETGEALLAALDDETDEDMRQKLVYLMGACRCLNAEDYLVERLQDRSDALAMRQTAWNALAKLGTETAWKAWEEVGFKLVVRRVAEGSQAETLGLRPGDAILRYNDSELFCRSDLEHAMAQVSPDAGAAPVVIERDGEQSTLLFAPGSLGVYLDEVLR